MPSAYLIFIIISKVLFTKKWKIESDVEYEYFCVARKSHQFLMELDIIKHNNNCIYLSIIL